MRKTSYSIILIISALFLCGFKAGIDLENEKDAAKKAAEPTGPVVEYQETIAPQKNNQELYKQYYLLAVSSLDEAQSSFLENKLWTYRMVQNASNYTKLLVGLVTAEHEQEYLSIVDKLIPIIKELKAKNLYASRAEAIKTELKDIEKALEQDYSWEKVKAWIKE